MSEVTVTLLVEDGVDGICTHEKTVRDGDLFDSVFTEKCVDLTRDLFIRARNARDPEAIAFYEKNPELA